jgi:hypothetical protein
MQSSKGELTEMQNNTLIESGDLVVCRVRDAMSELMSPLFRELATTTAEDQCAQTGISAEKESDT